MKWAVAFYALTMIGVLEGLAIVMKIDGNSLAAAYVAIGVVIGVVLKGGAGK
jgi:hypothetical protein